MNADSIGRRINGFSWERSKVKWRTLAMRKADRFVKMVCAIKTNFDCGWLEALVYTVENRDGLASSEHKVYLHWLACFRELCAVIEASHEWRSNCIDWRNLFPTMTEQSSCSRHRLPDADRNYVARFHWKTRRKDDWCLSSGSFAKSSYKVNLSVKRISVDCLSMNFICVSMISQPIRAKQKTANFFCSKQSTIVRRSDLEQIIVLPVLAFFILIHTNGKRISDSSTVAFVGSRLIKWTNRNRIFMSWTPTQNRSEQPTWYHLVWGGSVASVWFQPWMLTCVVERVPMPCCIRSSAPPSLPHSIIYWYHRSSSLHNQFSSLIQDPTKRRDRWWKS